MTFVPGCWKLSHKHSPNKNSNKQGSYVVMSTILSTGNRITYFGQLMPIEVVPTVEFKNEWVVDLCPCPYLTIQAEEEKKE